MRKQSIINILKSGDYRLSDDNATILAEAIISLCEDDEAATEEAAEETPKKKVPEKTVEQKKAEEYQNEINEKKAKKKARDTKLRQIRNAAVKIAAGALLGTAIGSASNAIKAGVTGTGIGGISNGAAAGIGAAGGATLGAGAAAYSDYQDKENRIAKYKKRVIELTDKEAKGSITEDEKAELKQKRDYLEDNDED